MSVVTYTIENTLDLPRLNLKDRQRFDLELLMVGGFAPLTGFLNEADYNSVVKDMRLRDGALWPIPVVLDVPDSFQSSVGDTIVLCDPYGKPLANLQIESRWKPDKTHEVKNVYGTDDLLHPGVRYVMNQMHDTYIGGTVEKIQLESRQDFKECRYTPKELKQVFANNGWSDVVAFQTRNPMHRAHFELIKRAHEKTSLPVVIHPVVGMTREGDIDYITRVHTYKIICEKYAQDFAMLALLPLAMRMAGPREALWHMLIRKNYGFSHFIVGRDHAGPGTNSQGQPFYEPDAARVLAEQYQDEAGIAVIASPLIAYSPNEKTYIESDTHSPATDSVNISGTEFRKMLLAGEPIPEWFSFTETIALLQARIEQQKRRGFTIFFTGLSGSGKSTIASMLATKLGEVQDRLITILDGDVIQGHLNSELGFSKEHRDLKVTRVGYVASEIAKHGGIAICAMIAPYQKARDNTRELVAAQGSFIEVYLKTPLTVCESRDVKGLYEKARLGEIKNFTGVSDPYEIPTGPEIIIDTSNQTPEQSVNVIITYLAQEGYLPTEKNANK